MYIHLESPDGRAWTLKVPTPMPVAQALQLFHDALVESNNQSLVDPKRDVLTARTHKRTVHLRRDDILPAGFTDNDDLFVTTQRETHNSAIAASQSKAGQHSYYYSVNRSTLRNAAHASEQTSAPTPIAVSNTGQSRSSAHDISKYSMMDDDTRVRVHVPMAGVDALAAGSIHVDFRERSFDLHVRTNDGKTHRLHVPILQEQVVPEECTVRRRPGKLILSLSKKDGTKAWYELRKSKGVGDTEYGKIQPDFGESFRVEL